MDIAVIAGVISIIVSFIVALVMGQAFDGDADGSVLALLGLISIQLSAITGILVSLYARIRKKQKQDERREAR
ncbi:hypothetical protein [Paenibacillus sp. MMS18-CY102]|uniref:hypothetical protein n=1 Tax=Paenibacillus sp. MMS18-CY102 TaxID=2682849 RepID=UPI00136548A6|nr:hypothetical protein [Paenibacillus sp. MMS18-CY102]MWC29690.1 hypothetical protein [Paenibacillus sp. MMS18-CY102]